MNWWQTLASLILGGGGAGVAGSLLKDLVQRPKTKAEAVLTLTDAAKRLVDELQEEVTAARKETAAARIETAAARDETAEARRHVRLLTAEVDACLQTMRNWRAAIWAPDATLPRLRAMVGTEPGANGTP